MYPRSLEADPQPHLTPLRHSKLFQVFLRPEWAIVLWEPQDRDSGEEEPSTGPPLCPVQSSHIPQAIEMTRTLWKTLLRHHCITAHGRKPVSSVAKRSWKVNYAMAQKAWHPGLSDQISSENVVAEICVRRTKAAWRRIK